MNFFLSVGQAEEEIYTFENVVALYKSVHIDPHFFSNSDSPFVASPFIYLLQKGYHISDITHTREMFQFCAPKKTSGNICCIPTIGM